VFYNNTMNASSTPLNDSSSIITAEAIRSFCATRYRDAIAIEVVDEIGSTNAALLERLEKQADDTPTGPTLLVARRQTAGRGRAGRTWDSDSSSLTFSVAWKFLQPIASLSGLSLAIGVILVEALDEMISLITPVSETFLSTSQPQLLQLKWPNDILQGQKKLAGILIETISDSGLLREDSWAVIGIGINIKPRADNQDFLRPVDPLRSALPPIDRNGLLGLFLERLQEKLPIFSAQGFAPFRTQWNARHAHAGRRVDIMDHGKNRCSGIAMGVDSSGRLLLQIDDDDGPSPKVIAVVAGDVSLRPADGELDAPVD
jgi:BirA family biotin operon repressor/biotin-[acetyl-CoA-carboxylase] ligase